MTTARLTTAGLTAKIEASATAKAYQRLPVPGHTIHGSSHYKCALMQVYRLLGTTKTNVEFVWKYELAARQGDAIHSHVQDELFNAGLAAVIEDDKPALEVSLDEKTLTLEAYTEFIQLKLGIRMDALVIGANGQEIPVEIKTVADKDLNGSNRKYFGDKLADYEAQLQLTMHFWRDKKTVKRPRYGLIYVVNRSDISQREEYIIEYDAAFIEGELEHIKLVRDAWQSEVLPEPEPERGTCRFCEWRDLCPAKNKKI